MVKKRENFVGSAGTFRSWSITVAAGTSLAFMFWGCRGDSFEKITRGVQFLRVPASLVTVPDLAKLNRLILTDGQFYTKGKSIAFASPWCASTADKTLIEGTDYNDTISLNPNTFPNDVIFEHSWPRADAVSHGCGVYGYLHVAFGNFVGGQPEVTTPPRKVRDLVQLSEIVSYSLSNEVADFNVLNEFYLTTTAGDWSTKVLEVGFLLHASDAAKTFFRNGVPLGTYTDKEGIEWRIARQTNFVMIMKADSSDAMTVKLDIKDLLDHLILLGTITGTEWFNGIGLGTEPVKGRGKMHLTTWKVSIR